MECVSGDRLASALAMRRGELWDTNFRLAERIEMRIKDAQRAHRQAHGTTSEALRCLLEQHPEHTTADGNLGWSVPDCVGTRHSCDYPEAWYLQRRGNAPDTDAIEWLQAGSLATDGASLCVHGRLPA